MSKINIAHGFRKAFLDGISSWLDDHPDEIDPRKALREGGRKAEAFVRKKITEMTERE